MWCGVVGWGLACLQVDVEDKLAIIEYGLSEIDQPFVASAYNWFAMHRLRALERVIIHLFSNASREELNWLVAHVKLALLFYKIKDHSGGTDQKARPRTDLIETVRAGHVTSVGASACQLTCRVVSCRVVWGAAGGDACVGAVRGAAGRGAGRPAAAQANRTQVMRTVRDRGRFQVVAAWGPA
jgi:hypothetical protein